MPDLSYEELTDRGAQGIVFFSPELPDRRLQFVISPMNRRMRIKLHPYFELSEETLDLERAFAIVEALVVGRIRGTKYTALGRLLGYIIRLKLSDGVILEYRTSSLRGKPSSCSDSFGSAFREIDNIVQVKKPKEPSAQLGPSLCWKIPMDESDLKPTY